MSVRSSGAAVAHAIVGHGGGARRCDELEVIVDGDRLDVTLRGLDSETFAAVVAALRGVPGRRWDAARKVNVIPVRARRQLWGALNTALPVGAHITGPQGTRVVARAD